MPKAKQQESGRAARSKATGKPGFSVISNKKLLQIYTMMVKCRMIEERTCLPANQSQAFRHAKVTGHEAALVGAAIDLGPEDFVAVLDRNFDAAMLARGASIAEMLRKPPAGSANSLKRGSSSAAQLKAAVEAARAGKERQSGAVAVVFALAPNKGQDALLESLVLAGIQKLPMIFVRLSGAMQVAAGGSSPTKSKKEGVDKKRSTQPNYGLPAFNVDGHDVVAVYRVAFESIARARKGRGPSLIECEPYRVKAHGSEGRSGSHRHPEAGLEEGDAIARMETYLAAKGLFAAGARQRIARRFRSELDAALAGNLADGIQARSSLKTLRAHG
jgi:TPP-dependent pyruvate/acetoin dehydrogenase alpha subunit